MPVESATYIGNLDKTYPLQDDDVSQGDDHLRLIKETLQNTFPGFTAALTASVIELNYVDGVTSGIQAQFAGLGGRFVETDNGNQTINGSLHVVQSVYVDATDSNSLDGFGINDAGNNLVGAFYYDEDNGHAGIVQRTATDVNETTLELFQGKVKVLSDSHSTAPVLDEDLTNKKYVVDNFLGSQGDQTVDGELNVHHGVRVLADTVDSTDWYTITYQGYDRASFIFDEASGAVSIHQRNTFGDDVTLLRLLNGTMTLNGAPVAVGSVAATSAGASGSFVDKNNKTVTVVNGLITDLG